MKKFSRRLYCAIIVIGFLISLFWVEGSSWSSQAVAQYNGGYGTFDMKTYDVHTVEAVLASMSREGYQISYCYYVGDTIFLVFFCLLQYMISKFVYNSLKLRNRITYILFILSITLPILRGIADSIENVCLVVTLIRYPMINKGMIGVATMATQIKLGCIKLWGVLMVVGVLFQIVQSCKGILHENK